MDENLHHNLIDDIRAYAKEVDGIIDTEKCYVRKAGMVYHLDLHAIVDSEISVKKGHYLAHQLKDALMEKIPNLGHVSIHIEPDE
jgi:divalent metal cation (Fe/Co/Zn/Cd) transporter